MRAPDPIDLTGNSSLHVLLEILISEGSKLNIVLSSEQSVSGHLAGKEVGDCEMGSQCSQSSAFMHRGKYDPRKWGEERKMAFHIPAPYWRF